MQVMNEPPVEAAQGTAVLVVHGDRRQAWVVSQHLRDRDLQVVAVSSTLEALGLVRVRRFGVIFIDLLSLVGGPITGLDLCRLVRGESRVPIIAATSEHRTTGGAMALASGVTECVPSSAEGRDVAVRIRANLRQAARSRTGAVLSVPVPLVAGPLQLVRETHQVYRDGRPVAMPLKEFRLLEALMERPNRAVSRRTLLAEVWGPNYAGDTRTLDVHILRIRRKVEERPAEPELINTVRGLGYKLVDKDVPFPRRRP